MLEVFSPGGHGRGANPLFHLIGQGDQFSLRRKEMAHAPDCQAQKRQPHTLY
jgi:hypothetical protein